MAILPYVPGAYCFAEVVGSIVHPIAGTQVIGGQLGIGSIVFEMTQDKVDQKVVSDGYAYANYRLGALGKITIECLSGSQMDQYLVAMANDVETAVAAGVPDSAIAAVVRVRDISTGSSHTAIGVGISKQPPRTYTGDLQPRQWVLLAAELTNG